MLDWISENMMYFVLGGAGILAIGWVIWIVTTTIAGMRRKDDSRIIK